MKPKIIYILLLVTLISIKANAQESFQFTLQEAVEYAMSNQVNIKNAELDKEIAKQKVRETVAIGLPQIDGKASIQNFLDIPTQVLPDFISPAVYGTLVKEGVIDGNGNPIQMPTSFGSTPVQFGTNFNMSYGIDISQLIFDGNYLLGLKAASVYKDLSIKALKRSKIETQVNVSKAYYNVLVAQKNIELLDANIVQLKKTLDDTKAYYDQGFVEKIDIDRLNVLYNNLVTERENISRIVDLSKVLLKFQMGMPIASKLELKDKLEDVVLQQNLNSEEGVNLEGRVEFQLLKTQMRLNELDYKRNIVNRAPSLVAFGSFSRNGLSNEFSTLTDVFYPTSIIGLQLNVPILGSGKKYYQTKQAKLNLEKSKNDLKNLENALSLESKSANVTFNNSVNSLNNQRKNMDLASEILRVSKAKYEQGVGSSIEVVTAQTSLKEAETNYINALFNALVAKIELEKSKGNIQ
ncbi:MAG: TolC family protein [bacterium]|jgi:outer membrane protein